MSLIREKTKVFRAALSVYIRVEQKFTSKSENNPIHSQEKIIRKKSNEKKRKITLVANKLRRYKRRFIKASRYMYSTPKYRANIVKNNTKLAPTKAKLSMQKTRCESIKSRQKNHRPKSIQQ